MRKPVDKRSKAEESELSRRGPGPESYNVTNHTISAKLDKIRKRPTLTRTTMLKSESESILSRKKGTPGPGTYDHEETTPHQMRKSRMKGFSFGSSDRPPIYNTTNASDYSEMDSARRERIL